MRGMKQFKGPFQVGQRIAINDKCLIGISINEDDYMRLGSDLNESEPTSLEFKIKHIDASNDQSLYSIQMGKTQVYQLLEQSYVDYIEFIYVGANGENYTSSVIIDVVYL